MDRILTAGFVALTIATIAGVAAAQDMRAVIDGRQQHFKDMGGAMKEIGDQLKSGKPSLADVQIYAKRLDDLAPQLSSWFPQGSGPDSVVKTHAKADIWQNPGDFKQDADALAVEAHKLNAVAMSGDMEAVGAQLKAVGQTCGTCHKAFREKED